MIELNLSASGYYTELTINSTGHNCQIMLDTGVPCCVMTSGTLANLLKVDISYVLRLFKTYKNPYTLYSYSNDKAIKCIPIYLRWVDLAEAQLQKMYFMLTEAKGRSKALLGRDFITSCHVNILHDSSAIVEEIDPISYANKFKALCDGREIMEVNALGLTTPIRTKPLSNEERVRAILDEYNLGLDESAVCLFIPDSSFKDETLLRASIKHVAAQMRHEHPLN